MKTITLITILLFTFACTEEVIVEKIVEVPKYITQTITKTDTLVTTKDTVYIEREANVTYNPKYEQFVLYFFDKVNPLHEMITMDIYIDDIPMDLANGSGARYNTNINTVQNGVLIIYIAAGCPEATIYRELLHHLYAWPYQDEWQEWQPEVNDYIMAKNWGRCLENMNEDERAKYLSTYGLQ